MITQTITISGVTVPIAHVSDPVRVWARRIGISLDDANTVDWRLWGLSKPTRIDVLVSTASFNALQAVIGSTDATVSIGGVITFAGMRVQPDCSLAAHGIYRLVMEDARNEFGKRLAPPFVRNVQALTSDKWHAATVKAGQVPYTFDELLTETDTAVTDLSLTITDAGPSASTAVPIHAVSSEMSLGEWVDGLCAESGRAVLWDHTSGSGAAEVFRVGVAGVHSLIVANRTVAGSIGLLGLDQTTTPAGQPTRAWTQHMAPSSVQVRYMDANAATGAPTYTDAGGTYSVPGTPSNTTMRFGDDVYVPGLAPSSPATRGAFMQEVFYRRYLVGTCCLTASGYAAPPVPKAVQRAIIDLGGDRLTTWITDLTWEGYAWNIPTIRSGRNIAMASGPRGRLIVGTDQGIWGRITAATPAGTRRWTYTFTEAIPKAESPYYTSGTLSGNAINLRENENAATGIQGNGVNATDLEGTLDLQPAAVGKGLVRLWGPYIGADNTEIWVFSEPNGVSGDCATGVA